MTHPEALPHGELEELFENAWFVQGQMKMPIALPMRLSRSMTVLRCPDSKELTLINTIRLDEAGLEALDALGKVSHVVRVAGFHGRDDAFYRDTYGAKLYAIKGQSYVRSMKGDVDPEDGYMQPDVWLEHGDSIPLAGSSVHVVPSATPPEALLRLEVQGGTLISGDALQNMPKPDRFTNFSARLFMGMMGFFNPHKVGPGWVKGVKPKGADLMALLDIDFENLLPAHGDAVIGGAREKFRASIEATARRCK